MSDTKALNCPLCNHNIGAHSKLGCFHTTYDGVSCACGETPRSIELLRQIAQLREHIRILREALQGMIDLCIVEEKYEISEIETAKSALEVTK